jgi:hypothetical protein
MLDEEQLRGLYLDGEILLNVPSFNAAEGGIGHDHVVAFADLANVFFQGVPAQDARRRDAVQDHVHQAQEGGNRLLLCPVERLLLQGAMILDGPLRMPHPQIRLGQEATGPTCRIVHRLAALRVHQLHDEADDGSWRIKLAGHAVFAPQPSQQFLIDLRNREDIVLAVEVDAVDELQDVFQVVTRGADDDVALGEDAADGVTQGIVSQVL